MQKYSFFAHFMQPSIAVAVLLILSCFCACKKDAATGKDNAPGHLVPNAFAEGKNLACPENTKRIEKMDSSYPEFYCLGEDGKTGPWLDYDINGRLRTRANYDHDMIEGEWILYHTNGTIDTKGYYVHSQRQGEWVQWYVDGTKRSVKHYKDNIIHGRVELFYRNGHLMAEGDYIDNFEEGPWKVYTPEGKLARECRLDHGEEKDCIVHIKEFQIKSRKFGEGRTVTVTEDS